MASTDIIEVKNVSWIQRFNVTVKTDDAHMIQELEEIIDGRIHDGVFSIHFEAVDGLSYEAFGYKKYGAYVDCLILCYYGDIKRLTKSRQYGWKVEKVTLQSV